MKKELTPEKEEYITPQLEFIVFKTMDIITTSDDSPIDDSVGGEDENTDKNGWT